MFSVPPYPPPPPTWDAPQRPHLVGETLVQGHTRMPSSFSAFPDHPSGEGPTPICFSTAFCSPLAFCPITKVASPLSIFTEPVSGSMPGPRHAPGDYNLNELILLAKIPSNYSYQMRAEAHIHSISTEHSKDLAVFTEGGEPTQPSKG